MEVRKSQSTITESENTNELAVVKQDKEVVAIQGKIEKLQDEVKDLVIKDEKTGKYGTDLLSFIKTAYNNLEIKRKFFVQPLNTHIKNINSEFKALQEPLEELEKQLKAKLLVWHKQLQAKAEEDAKKVAEEEERKRQAAAKTAKDLDLPVLPDVAPVTHEPERVQIRGALGSTHLRKKWSFEVVDISQVPVMFMAIDNVAVNNAIRAGERNIPGLRIYEEDILANR